MDIHPYLPNRPIFDASIWHLRLMIKIALMILILSYQLLLTDWEGLFGENRN